MGISGLKTLSAGLQVGFLQLKPPSPFCVRAQENQPQRLTASENKLSSSRFQSLFLPCPSSCVMSGSIIIYNDVHGEEFYRSEKIYDNFASLEC